MSLQSVPLLSVDFLPSRPVEIEVSPAPLTSDAGLIPIRQFDEQIRLTEQFAAVLDDPRDPTLTRQSLLSMVRQRIDGILAAYEDQNDHDTRRSDPVFKLIADRLPDDPDLASQPTLSRFENAASIPDLWRLRDVLVDLFIQSFDTPPHHLTLDIDAFDDPAHGQQQRIMFHGYDEPYQYLPIVITCAYAFTGWDPLFSRVSVKSDSRKIGGLRLSDTRKPLVFSHPGPWTRTGRAYA